jgi:hypothetical protein
VRPRSPWFTRSRTRAAALVAIALATLGASLALSVVVELGSRTPVAAVHRAIASATPDRSAEVLQLPLGAGGQDARATRGIRSAFAGVPIDVARAVVVGPWALDPDGAKTLSVIESSPSVMDAVRTTSGSLDSLGPTRIALDDASAHRLGIVVGDTMRVHRDDAVIALTVAALWTPRHADALLWAAAPAGFAGSDGRILATAATVSAGASTPDARWAIAPAETLVPGQLAAAVHGFAHVGDAVAALQSASSARPSVSGRGGDFIAELQRGRSTLASIIPVPLVAIALASAVALVMLATLLTGARTNETRLLRARGASVARLAGVGAVETTVLAVPTAALGAFIAQLGLQAFGLSLGNPTGVIVTPTIVAAAAIAIVTAVTAISSRESSGATREDSGRGSSAVFLSVGALLLALGGLALWRLLQYGLPTAGHPADPSGVLAPAILLCAFATLGLLAFSPSFAALERRVSRTERLLPSLPVRHVRRSAVIVAAPVALVALAVGSALMAGTYSATSTRFLADSTRLMNGSDVRVVSHDSTILTATRVPESQSSLAQLTGTTVSPVMSFAATSGDSQVAVVGVDSAALPGLVTNGSSVIDDADVAALHPGSTGLALPGGATTLRLTIDASRDPSANDAALLVSAWLADRAGNVVRATAPRMGFPVAAESDLSLPAGGPWALLALDVGVNSRGTVHGLRVTIDPVSVRVGGATRPFVAHVGDWAPQAGLFASGLRPVDGAAIGFTVTKVPGGGLDQTVARLMPAGHSVVPVLVSRDLAASGGFARGDRFDLSGDFATVSASVVGVLPIVPGVASGPAVLADLRTLESGVLRTSEDLPAVDETWVATADPAAATRAAIRVGGPDVTVTTASTSLAVGFVSGAIAALWLSALACLVFALVALGAVFSVLATRRRDEVVLLRALGSEERVQRRSRRIELALVVGYSLVLGLVSGEIVTSLVIGTLARLSASSAAQVLPVNPTVAAAPLALLLLAAALGVVAIGWRWQRSVSDVGSRS